MNKLIKIALISIYIMIATAPNFVYAGPEHGKHNEPSNESSDEHEHEEDKKPSDEHQHEEGNDNHDDDEDDDNGHDDGGSDGHGGHDDHGEEESGVSLSQQQQDLAEIQVEALQARNHEYSIYAPAEIQANGYTSFLVSPRVDSVVLKRHKALGDHVQKGDKLVTLFSESVAEAQVSLKVSKAEWARVKQLGRQTVGASRYIKAENDFELSQARLLAFGLSNQAIKNKSTTLGEYTLIAQTSGAILSDDFQQGQRVEAGHALMLLSDESQLWVEARIQASAQINLPVGTLAQVKVGDSYYPARVSQEAHTIDEKTRTRVIRLLIDNPDHKLHAGEFADVYFSMKTKKAVTTVPENALMRSADGDWVVFIESELNQFAAVEVKLGRVLGENREIFGLKVGTKIVTKGAFFVSSEIAKGGFDPHNH